MVPALMTGTGNRPTWEAVDARLAKVIAVTGPDGRLGWILPLTGGLIRAGEVVALSVYDWKFATVGGRFMVDAVGAVTDFRGTWIALYGWPVLEKGRLGDRVKIEARLTSVKPEQPPD
jgi:hypothetical protein